MSTSKTQVHFKFNDGTSDQDVSRGLACIGHIAGVFNVEALFPGTMDPVIKLMHFSDIEESANAHNIVSLIEALPNVQFAHVPSARKAL